MNSLKKALSLEALILYISSLFSTAFMYGYDVTHSVKPVNALKKEVTITFSLKPDEYLYKDSLSVTVNSPALQISPLRPATTALRLFDKSFEKEKEVYIDNASFTVEVSHAPSQEVSDALLFVPFLVNTDKEHKQITVPLSFNQSLEKTANKPVEKQSSLKEQASHPSNLQQPVPVAAPHVPQKQEDHQEKANDQSFLRTIFSSIHATGLALKNFLSTLFSSTSSPFTRGASAFLLGLLLSLTPCIYPMIPITVGILQASGSTSPLRNFLLALSYTLGISTVFSLFGFLAAMGGPAFGELQGNPLFVIPVAALLFYFGLSMFDLVHLPIPKFLQPKPGKVKAGSLVSAYFFGAVSGTIASPCLSPGLILILHYIATIADGSLLGSLKGLILLFIFGIGSSVPLLIIGTFSGSLKMLPKSGLWMVEIKKLIGIMLMSMALYHLSHLERIIPWHILVWVLVLVYGALGLFYLAKSMSSSSKGMSIYRTIMGTALFIIAGLIAVQGYKAVHDHWYPPARKDTWLHEYHTAFNQAKEEGKLLFIDVGASYCSACKSLHARIFTKPAVTEALKSFVVLGIEADLHTDSYKAARAAYGSFIEGFPTYLVINPTTGKVLKDWSVEIEELGVEGVKEQLEALAKGFKDN